MTEPAVARGSRRIRQLGPGSQREGGGGACGPGARRRQAAGQTGSRVGPWKRPGALGLAGLGRGKGEWRSGPESGLAEALAWARAGLGRAGEGKEGVGRGFGWARLGLGFGFGFGFL